MKAQLWRGLVLVAGIFITHLAVAADEPTSTYNITDVRKNIRAGYQLWLRGPNIRDFSGGDRDNKTNILMTHYFSVGYKLPAPWSIGVNQPFTQTIDEKPQAAADAWIANDPYATLSNAEVWGNKKYGLNLFAYLRYYAPFSRATSKNVAIASPKEAGNGQLRFLINPSKAWLDGDLNLTLTTLLQYRFASNSTKVRAARNGGNPDREDMLLVFDPILGYMFTKEIEGYLEYAAILNHHTNGTGADRSWTSYKAEDYVAIGANLQVTKKLNLNPYLDSSPRLNEFKNAGIGLNAVYSFL